MQNANSKMSSDQVKTHAVYDSALQNVLEAAGYAHSHASKLPVTPADEIESLETEAVSQARDLIDCGECCCCEAN